MREIGIMQGRLLPRFNGRYQAHPLQYWQAEFYVAQVLGFNQIEFILDHNDYKENPLMSEEGLERISDMIKSTGVKVKSVCADYFMEAPFHFPEHQKKSEEILEILIKNASRLGVVDIVVPCVDQSTLKNEEDVNALVSSISKVLPIAENASVNINFETDLAPIAFKELLEKFDSEYIKVNYDIGNSSSLGYDTKEEFAAYGHYISDLHIKDRILNGGSVELGTGNADFDTVFSLLKEVGFKGNIIMQAARDKDYIDDLTLVRKELLFSKNYVEKYLG